MKNLLDYSKTLLYCLSLAFFVSTTVTSTAQAEHAVINLEVIAPEKSAKAESDEEPPLGGSLPRPILSVNAGDPLAMQFILVNVYPHGVINKVTVRYFVVRIDKIGQKTVPPLEASKDDPNKDRIENNVVAQGHVVMNFKPKCRVGGRMLFRVPKPGIYLVRIETQNTQADHEHFAAIDLEVK